MKRSNSQPLGDTLSKRWTRSQRPPATETTARPIQEAQLISGDPTFVKTEDGGEDVKRDFGGPVPMNSTSDARDTHPSDTEAAQRLQNLILGRNACTTKVEALSSQILTGERGLGILTRQLYETQLAIKRRELEIGRLKLLYQQETDSLRDYESAIRQLGGGRSF